MRRAFAFGALASPPVRTANIWRPVLKRLNSVLTLSLILFAAGALHAQNVTVDKTSLSFFAQMGGSAVTQTLNISSSGAQTNFFTFSNAAWLKANPQTGSTPSAITVSADPTGLNAGIYNGMLTVYGGSGPSVQVQVTFTVSALGISPQSFAFAYQSGGTLPAQQTITLTGQATFTASASTTSGGNWLQISPAAGTSPTVINVSLNSAVVNSSMPGGTYNGTIVITPTSGVVLTPINIPVALTVTAAPPVTPSPAAINLNYQIGGANNTTSQTLTISTTGAQALSYGLTASVDPNPAGRVWILTNPTSGTIPANGSAQISIGYDITANLPAGTYNGKVTLLTPGGTPTQQDIPVKLVVSTAPVLNVPTATLAFTYQLNGAVPAGKTVTATSSAVAGSSTTGQMALTITAATQSGGNWLNAPTQNPVTGTPFTVSVNPVGLAPGNYSGTVTVTGTGAANGPQQIPVTLTVSNDAQVVGVVNGCSSLTQSCTMVFANQIGQNPPATQNVKVTSSTGGALNYAVTSTTSSCNNSWLVLGGTTSGTTDGTFTVSVNAAGIAAGTTCSGTISIAATNAVTGAAAPNSPVSIPVSLYVSNNALLLVNPSALSFTAPVSGSAPSQSITLGSTSTTEQLNYTVAFAPDNGGNWLFLNTQGGTTAPGSNVIGVTVMPGLLSAGLYTGKITITATSSVNGAVPDSPVVIPVNLQITAGTMSVTPTSLTFSQTLGGSVPAAQTFTVSSSGSPLGFTIATSTGGTGNWLTATPATGNTPGTISVSLDGSKLTPGQYTGSVTVTSSTPFAGGSPATVSVVLTVSPGTISASPATLTFTQVQNGPAPAAQPITVTGTPGAISFTASAASTGNWLSVSPASGTTNGTVQVSVNGASLAAGSYTGTVTITAPGGATGSPISIGVTLTVLAAQTITATPANLNFNYTVGLGKPAAQTVNVAASAGMAQFAATVSTTSGGNWLQVSAANGTTPAALSISVDPTGLAAGNYTGSVAITSPSSATSPAASIAVNLSVVQVPKPVIGSVANAASYTTGAVAPGENIVIFGTGIGPSSITKGTVNASGLIDTNVAGTRVLFDGVAAPIIYVSSTQSSVMVPYGISGRTSTNMVVEYLGVQSNAVSYTVVPTSPGIYTLNQAGTGPGAILNQDFSVNTSANPAAKGSYIQIYMTGEGITQPPGTDGGIAPTNGTGLLKPVGMVTAMVGGIPVANPAYFGSAPGIVYGVMQVNLQIPLNAPSGNVAIQVTVGGVTSQANVTVAVQ
jgi:uncharacterized protein (TIGR03437 family)